MSNNELQYYLPDSIPLSKSLAKRSASSGVSSPQYPSRKEKFRRDGGQLALYTWGTLATLSMIFSAAFLLTEVKIQESRRLAELEIQQHRYSKLVQAEDQATERLAGLPKPKKPIQQLAALLVPADQIGQITTASTQKGQDRVESAHSIGYGVSIGSSQSVEVLSSRYLALSNHAPELFIGLRPKIQFSRSNQNKNTAKLVVGPFSSETELMTFCKSVGSRMAVDCSQEEYAGKKLLLPPLL